MVYEREIFMNNIIVLAVKAFIVYKNKALIVKRSLGNSIGAGDWELAGGKLEFGENLEDGLKREVYEETQLNVTVEKLLFASSFKTHEHRQVVILDYLCYANTNNITISSEHDDYIWAGKKTLKTHLSKRLWAKLEEHNVFDYIDEDN